MSIKRISAWAILHPVPPVVLFVVLFFIGTIAFVRLPINLSPDISFPLVQVTVSQPGSAPTEIETQILTKIEGAVASVGNVHKLTSAALEGQALAFIEFQIGTPIDRAVADVRDAVAKVRSELPEGIQEPVVQRIDVEGGAIVYYALSTTALTEEELSWFVDDTITKRLLSIAGVAQVTRSGGVNREIRIELDPARMQALGITAVDVNQQLRVLNLDAPGGRAQIGGGEQSIRVLGGARTAEQLSETRILLPGGRIARLSDLAFVHDGIAEVRSMSRLNGRPTTIFGVFKAKGSSDISVAKEVEQELAKITKENPSVKMTKVFTTVAYTQEMYDSAINALVEGSILAVIVVWFFLRDWRSTAISALAIPLSAIPTFAFMQMMGFTLNQVSLLALSLVAGVLVDDAIVEIENIVRHKRMGKTGFQAALDAADEIGLAVVATSATIIAVFVPVSFMPGITGQYFRQFGLTVAAAVFFSLLVARLITPVIAAYTLKADKVVTHGDGPIMTRYLAALRWCVEHRWRTLAFGTVFFILSVLSMAFVEKSFIPAADMGSAQLSIELPSGVRLEDTAAVAAQAYHVLRQQPEVTDVVESIGTDETGEVRRATLFVSLVPRSERDVSQKDWERRVIKELKRIPDARIDFSNQSGAGGGRDVNLYVVGSDPVQVTRSAQKLVQEMRGLSEVRDPRINADMSRPEILIRPRLDLAAQLGVTVSSISQTVRIATLGDLPQNAAEIFAFRPADPNSCQLDRERAARPLRHREPAGADQLRPVGPAQGGRRHQLRRGPDPYPSFQPESPRLDRGGPERRRARHRYGQDPRLADGKEPATGHTGRRYRRRGSDGRAVREFRHRDVHRRIDGLRGAGAAVRPRVPADHHPVGFAPLHRRRRGGTRHFELSALAARGHRLPHVDGNRRQEFHPAGGLRHRGDARGQGSSDGTARSGPQARATDRHDHGGDGRRHAPGRDRYPRRQFLPWPDGGRGDRRFDHLDDVDAGDRARRLHASGRHRALARAQSRQDALGTHAGGRRGGQ